MRRKTCHRYSKPRAPTAIEADCYLLALARQFAEGDIINANGRSFRRFRINEVSAACRLPEESYRAAAAALVRRGVLRPGPKASIWAMVDMGL